MNVEHEKWSSDESLLRRVLKFSSIWIRLLFSDQKCETYESLDKMIMGPKNCDISACQI